VAGGHELPAADVIEPGVGDAGGMHCLALDAPLLLHRKLSLEPPGFSVGQIIGDHILLMRTGNAARRRKIEPVYHAAPFSILRKTSPSSLSTGRTKASSGSSVSANEGTISASADTRTAPS